MILHLDYETWSPTPIRRGTDAYLIPAKPLLLTYAVGEEPIRYLDFTKQKYYPLEPFLPMPILDLIVDSDKILLAHNAYFDRSVTSRLCGVDTRISRWRCSMAQALLHGLPGGLGPLCEVLGVRRDLAKIEDGHRLIRKFCCGKEPPDGNDLEWQKFIEYACNDISAMRECVRLMPNWNYHGNELRLWHVDQEINNRGFKVDVPLADNAILALKKEKDKLDDAIWIETCGSIAAATQRDKLLIYLCEQQGCILRDLTASTIREALEDESLDENVKEILRIRLAAAQTSTSKFKRLKESVGEGNRLRGTMQYAGAARTSRWAGRIFQPQNLPRPTMKLGDIRNVIELLRNGEPEIVSLFAPMGQACMNVLRGLIIASDDSDLMISDYSAIEGRANAWVAGEDWKVKAFRDKEEIYCRVYEQAFGLPKGSVAPEGDPRRQSGKVMELALGFGGGVGAFLNMAAVYNLDLEELGRTVVPEEKAIEAWERAVTKNETFGLSKEVYTACDTLKIRYRRANPAITKSWYMYEDAARTVIEARDPSLKVNVGPIVFDCSNTCLRIKLPSGRYLCYWLPKIRARYQTKIYHDETVSPQDAAFIEEAHDMAHAGDINYMSWRNKQWSRTKTYGGKLCENIVQAIARDLLGFALLSMHDAGFPVVLHIHDEVIADVARALGLTFEQFNTIMQSKPKWAVGFPLEAKGFQSERYEKR